ncbi:hypothetical protein [Kitasatospora sp. NBC_01539]|uniref:hypothetical protein n=1 Tax=Kitasatospora sp. NBC_01539 TaxID=2903577 RepID=UPI0038601671
MTEPAIETALAHGWAYLRTPSHADWSLTMSLEPSMPAADVFTAAQARSRIRRLLGTDIGLDLSRDGFGAMLALLFMPAAERALVCALGRRVRSCQVGSRFRFFPDVPRFAADTDSTAVAAAALHRHGLLGAGELSAVAAELRGAVARTPPAGSGLRDGVVLVYWEDGTEPDAEPRGRKHDAVACANSAYTRHLAGTGQGDAGIAYLREHTESGRFLRGTRYYPAPAAFLHAASRGCARFDSYATALGEPLRAAFRAYAAQPAVLGALDLALLTAAADNLGLTEGQTRRRAALARLQEPDGSWPAHAYFRMGRLPVHFGSRRLTTLLALTALHPPDPR